MKSVYSKCIVRLNFIGSAYKDFARREMKVISLSGNVYSFSVD